MEILNGFGTVEDCYRFLQKHFIERDTRMIADVHMGKMTREDFLDEARKKLLEIRAAGDVVEGAVAKLNKRVFGYGEEIDSLLDDTEVSDIRILGPDEIYYKKKGRALQIRNSV